MIRPESILESLITVVTDSGDMESLLDSSLSLLIEVSRARGGYLRVIDAAGDERTVRKNFSREAYRSLRPAACRSGGVASGVVDTSTGKVLILPLSENDAATGFVALDYRDTTVSLRENDTNLLGLIVRLIGNRIESGYRFEMMRRRYEEYKRVIEKAPIGILIFDQSGKLTSINPFHTAGMPARQGKDFVRTTNVLQDESIKQAGLLEYFEKLLEGEAFELFNHPYTTMFMRKNVFVDVRGVPVIGDGGKIEGGIVLISNVTEKARLEEELRASRDYLENIINSIDNEIVVVDRDHTIHLVNEAYSRNYKLEGGSLIGMKCYCVSHGEESPCTHEGGECPVRRIFVDGRTRTMVHRHRGKNGLRSVEVTFTPLKNKEGDVVHVIIVAQDITERLALEAEREKTREELKAVFEGITDSIMVIDRSLNIIKANSGSGLLYNMKTDDIIGRKCLDVIKGSGGGFLECPAGKTFKTGRPLTLTGCLLEIANRKIYADLFTYPSFDRDGNIAHVIMYIRDVTERKLLEQKYRDREALLANISSDSADAIFSLDDDDIITSWNKGAQKMFGYEEREVIGRNIELLIPREGRKQLEEIRTGLYREGFVRNVEARWRTKEGHEIDIIFTRTALTDTDGNVMGSSIVIKDISRLKEMSRELLHVEKLAVLGKMSATVAHEIRNPLGSITLNLDILEEEIGSAGDDKNPIIAELMSSIRSELRRLSLISDDYLRFTRYPKLNLAKIDFDDLIASAVGPIRTQLESRGIKLEIVPENGTGVISVDEYQIVQALRNLLVNASEAMPDPGTITVRYMKEGDIAVIRVFDTGVGIPSKDLDVIFDPFFTTKEKGTGLGLSIVQQIVELHGGRVECESTRGKGTCFTLRFPVGEHVPGGGG